MNVRSLLRVVTLLFSATFLFVLATLGGILFLSYRHCGADLGYLGCDTPISAGREDDEPSGPDITASGRAVNEAPCCGLTGRRRQKIRIGLGASLPEPKG